MTAARDIGPVLITGCSTGLGRASALAFREAGHLTVATARNIADLAPRARPTLQRAGDRALALNAFAVHTASAVFRIPPAGDLA